MHRDAENGLTVRGNGIINPVKYTFLATGYPFHFSRLNIAFNEEEDMKKYSGLIFILVLACAILSYTAANAQKKVDTDKKTEEGDGEKKFLGSGKFSIGFKAYYIWWDPAVDWGFTSYKFKEPYIHDFLYNPVFSAVFNDTWSLTGSLMVARMASLKSKTTLSLVFFGKAVIDITKYDADLLVNAKVKTWMKIYFGVKYLGTIVDIKSTQYLPLGVNYSYIPLVRRSNSPWHSLGLGVGNAYTAHVVENLYVLPNYSCMFLSSLQTANSASMKFTVGVMGSLSFAYYIEKARLTIEAGGRIQYLYNFYVGTNSAASGGSITGTKRGQSHDLFFGPYIGLVYAF